MRLSFPKASKHASCCCGGVCEGLSPKKLGFEPLEDRRLLDVAGVDTIWNNSATLSCPPEPRTLWVDDNGPNDPATGDYALSDPLEDGTVDHPFDLIREAIAAAQDGDTVVVADGVYPRENHLNNPVVDFAGKAITVRSENGPRSCILQGGQYVVAFDNGEGPDSILDGFTITGGDPNGGVACIDSSPTVINNVIQGNWSQYGLGAVLLHNSSAVVAGNVIAGNEVAGPCAGIVVCHGSDATITNNTIVGNGAATQSSNGAVHCMEGGTATVTNLISWDNGQYDLYGCSASYSCLEHDGGMGVGNIDSDPLFIDAPGGNFRLTPNSPCINAGDNAAVPAWMTTDLDGNARIVDGAVDMGAYESEHLGPRIIYVDVDADGSNNGTSWGDAINDLQDALAIADVGDEIRVAEGVYAPTDPGGSRDATFQLLNGVTLRGGYAGVGTALPDARDPAAFDSILSGDLNRNDGAEFTNREDNVYHVVTGTGVNETAVLDGFSIAGGHANGEVSRGFGGGLYGGAPTVVNCYFVANQALYGGGMYAAATVIDCVFYNNKAGYGGGLRDATVGDGSPTVVNSRFYQNQAEYGGGAFSSRYSTFEDCTFDENAAMHGGGMFVDERDPALSGCAFVGNTATDDGGGLSVVYGRPTLADCVFEENAAGIDPGNSGRGGGIFVNAGVVSLVDCTFDNNAGIYGAAVLADNAQVTLTRSLFRNHGDVAVSAQYDSSVTSLDCTFLANVRALESSSTSDMSVTNSLFSGNDRVAFFDGCDPILTNCTINASPEVFGLDGSSVTTLNNCIVWDYDTLEYNGDGHLVVESSCVEGWSGGVGNINADPLFIDADGPDNLAGTDDDNLRLSADSPCINGGDNAAIPPGVVTDLDGNARIVGDRVDMGAYEFEHPGPRMIYVDDNSPNDPGHGDPDSSDPNENGTQDHPFDAIQEAIRASRDGGTVIVLDGTYTGNGNRDVDFLGKAITVRSQNGPDHCIVDCQGTAAEPHRGFVFNSGETAQSVLEGLTIVGGYATYGGGISSESGASPVIRGNVITQNTAASGGGVFCRGETLVVGNQIVGNTAANGGGVDCRSDAVLRNNTIADNVATEDGGGVNAYERNMIADNTISGNRARRGGGVWTWEDYPATIINNVIRENWADDAGGGIGVSWDYQTIIAGNLIVGNGTYGDGAAIWMQSDPARIVNNTIVSNQSGDGVGGIYGGYYGQASTIANCVFWNNGDDLEQCTATYSCLGEEDPGEGNIYALPQFVDAAAGDYRLLPGSPCIDAGSNLAIPLQLTTDLDDHARIVGGIVDMGAYELLTQPSGVIGGNNYYDVDGDGVRDDGEAGLPGWTIYLDADRDRLLDDGERWVVTDSAGNYRFTDVSPGVYVVAEVQQPGWTQTAPAPLDHLLEIVSIADNGSPGSGPTAYCSQAPALSSDGRFVAFLSDQAGLVPNDTNGLSDIFVYDRDLDRIERISVAADGTQAETGCFAPAISADGRFVAFSSQSATLLHGPNNGKWHVFLYDRASHVLQRITTTADGDLGNGDSVRPTLSGDGRYVAFSSAATNLAPNDLNGCEDIFRYDRLTGATELVSLSAEGGQSSAASHWPSISADGQRIAFYSGADNLAPSDHDRNADVFVRDCLEGTVYHASISTSGGPGNGATLGPSISGDGRFVAFYSYADNLVPGDANGSYDVFLRDLEGGTTELVSISSSGGQANHLSENPEVSYDGRYVAFASYASNLVPGDTNASFDVFVRDRQEGTTLRRSLTCDGQQGDWESSQVALSADGRWLAFSSAARNMMPGYTSRQIYVANNRPLPGEHLVEIARGQTLTKVDFGNRRTADNLIVDTLVDENDGDYRPGDLSLREALALSLTMPGDDVIRFDAGLSGGTIVLDVALGQLRVDGNVEIRGLGADKLTIDAGGRGRVLRVDDGISASIRGLTLTGGQAGNGGAIRIVGGSLTVTDCTIRDNRAEQGGGIYAYNGTALTVVECTISGNEITNDGGGVFCENGVLQVSDSTITANRADDDGGGIYSRFSDTTIVNSTVSDNYAAEGGGLRIRGGRVHVSRCAFDDNEAPLVGGGAIFIREAAPDISQCTFRGNGTDNDYSPGGGAIYCYASSPSIEDCSFVANWTVGGAGAGVYCTEQSSPVIRNSSFVQNYDSVISSAFTVGQGNNFSVIDCSLIDNWGTAIVCNGNVATIDHCTIVGTRSSAVQCGYQAVATITNSRIVGNRGGIYSGQSAVTVLDSTVADNLEYGGICCQQGQLTVHNSIVWGNRWLPLPPPRNENVKLDEGAMASIAHSDIGGGFAGQDNIDADPQFISRGYWDEAGTPGYPFDDVWIDGDYHLQAGSPCVNAGDNAAVPPALTTDLDGNPRIFAGRVDMGAYELQQAPVPSVLYVDDSAEGADNGTSWQDAFTDLQDALAMASDGGVREIRVAEGVYRPAEVGGSREASFRLVSDVTVQGGYAGVTGTNPDARDISRYLTIVSGDLNGNDGVGFVGNAENSYHVVTGGGFRGSATLGGFTITAGNANGTLRETCGGGMYCDSSVLVVDCTFVGNSAVEGAGMHCSPTPHAVTNPMFTRVTFRENYATGNGGGLWIGDSDVTLTECTISGNHAGGDGGGVMFGSDNASKLVGCEIADNSANGNGGGMFTRFCFDWSMTDSTLAGNTAGGSGGAVCADYDSQLTINQCTIVGNTASDGGGGGIDVSSATVTVASSTISGNSAGEGGGIHNSGTLTLIGSIVAGNPGTWDPDFSGDMLAGGDYNLIGVWTGGTLPGQHSLVGTLASPLAPRLGPLGNYGGPTRTMPLLAGSPAIDAGDPDVVDPPATDQRGSQRIVDGNGDGAARIDIGAFEYVRRGAVLVACHVFYNHSSFDGHDPSANAADDAAIAPDKTPLRPGQSAAFDNYTSYDKGINGIMVDIAGLPVESLTADDFEFLVGNNNDSANWTAAPEPLSIDVFPSMGVGGSDRVTLIWPDGAIANRWLRVTVEANETTGLDTPDVFYFGNAIGESGNSAGNAIVNATDEIMASNFSHGLLDSAKFDDRYDYNRDGLVNATDRIVARNNQTNPLDMLRLITAPAVDGGVKPPFAEDSDLLTPSAVELNWLYELQRMNHRAAKQPSPAEAAVDKLLAMYW